MIYIMLYLFMDHLSTVLFILGRGFAAWLSLFSFTLFLVYILQVFLGVTPTYYSKPIRRERILLRAGNWFLFGVIFLLFAEIINITDLIVLRAASRLALFFLILSELAYQAVVLWPMFRKRVKWILKRST